MQVHSRSFSQYFVQSPTKSPLPKIKRDSFRFVAARPISLSVGLLTGLSIFCLPSVATASSENVLSHEQSIAVFEGETSSPRVRRVQRSRNRRSQQSQRAQAEPKQPRRIRFQPGTPPPDRGTPPAPYGTGSRGSCLQNAETPPLIQLSGSRGLDLTVSDHPSFWVYVPYSQGDVSTARFSLQKGNTEVYKQRVQLPTTPGIIEIAMPKALPALEAGTTYRWYFEIGCPQVDPSKEPVPATVTGVVQRVASSHALENDLAIASSPLEEVEAYANNHIWHETLSALAQLRQSDPLNQNLAEIWQNLLSDPNVGLENWAKLPIVGEAIAIRTDE